MLNFYHFLNHECGAFLFVFVPLTKALRIQLSSFFVHLFRFLKVLFQLNRIIEEALYKDVFKNQSVQNSSHLAVFHLEKLSN